jgi:hypothetical protein
LHIHGAPVISRGLSVCWGRLWDHILLSVAQEHRAHDVPGFSRFTYLLEALLDFGEDGVVAEEASVWVLRCRVSILPVSQATVFNVFFQSFGGMASRQAARSRRGLTGLTPRSGALDSRTKTNWNRARQELRRQVRVI